MATPSYSSESITTGYWRWDGVARQWCFRQPYDDPVTTWFDEVWEQVMGKHSDTDKTGVADQAEAELESPQRFAGGDGSVYERVDPSEFEEDDEGD